MSKDITISRPSELKEGDGGITEHGHVFMGIDKAGEYVFHTSCGRGGLTASESTVREWIAEYEPFTVQRQ